MKLEGQAAEDAEWVRSFGVGQEWWDGAASGFSRSRLAELKEAGVLLPHPEKADTLVVGPEV